MGDTTTLERKERESTTFEYLASLLPRSETHWRAIAARAHRKNARAGDEAAAKTHELMIVEIRHFEHPGSSRAIRYCPRCLKRGVKYVLLFMGGMDRCGTCRWPESNDSASQT